MPHVFSTITNPVSYVEYEGTDTGRNRPIKRSVTIKGGHGVAEARNLVTPYGVATQVTEDELAFLEANPAFQRHKARGFLTVRKSISGSDGNVLAFLQRWQRLYGLPGFPFRHP